MMATPVLAEFTSPLAGWLPVVILTVIGIGFAVVNIAASIILGPKRTGPGKEITYESGMIPIGDAHRRFNVRFYIVAMIFLVFDVEIIFFYPWASIFARHVRDSGHKQGLLLFMDMVVFIVILLVAYFYAWGKGVFRWD
jgi:NADH-quinone oxidoreductase subunit A